MASDVEMQHRFYRFASWGMTGALLAAPAVVALCHFFFTGSGPLVNDMLLHQLEVKRIASIFAAANEFPATTASLHLVGPFVRLYSSMLAWLEQWACALVCACDHVLGGHGLGFPLLHHYQHLPHLVVGLIGAVLEDPDLAFRGATAFMVGVGLPATLLVALLSLGSHPLTAAFATAVLPVLNDAPPLGQMQQGYQYNYGLGWGASMHGGHGLWTQPFAAAALIAAITAACHALTLRTEPTSPQSILITSETSVNSSSSNRGFDTSHTLRGRGIRIRRRGYWSGRWNILIRAAWVGAWIACAGLCNVLYGYMAGVAVGVAASLATLDAGWFRFIQLRGKRISSSSSSSSQEKQPPSLPPQGPPSQQQPTTVVAADPSEESTVGSILVGAVVLLVAGSVGGLLSCYFIGPHMWRREALSNYEARDYKLEGEGLRAALLLLSNGNLFDFGWQLPIPFTTIAGFQPMREALSVLYTVASAMPRLPVISFLAVGGAVTALWSSTPQSPQLESAAAPPPQSSPQQRIKEQQHDERPLVNDEQGHQEEHEKQLRLKVQEELRLWEDWQRARAGWLAARSAAVLNVVFLVLYAGYGGPPGGGWGADLTTKGSQASRAAAQRQRMRRQNKGGGHGKHGRSSNSTSSLSDEDINSNLVELLLSWLWPILARLSLMLAQGVQALPLVKSLHLHRFLGGCHLTALLLVPCAVEAFARGFDAIVAGAVARSRTKTQHKGEEEDVVGPTIMSSQEQKRRREVIQDDKRDESANKDILAAKKRKIPVADEAVAREFTRDTRSKMHPQRSSDGARCAVVVALTLLLVPAAVQRGLWVLVMEPRVRTARHAAAARAIPHIDSSEMGVFPSLHGMFALRYSLALPLLVDHHGASQLMATLRALPPGRVWAGDRSSATSFAKSRVEDAGHVDVADGGDDLLFVHLLQRGMGCGSSNNSIAAHNNNNSVGSRKRVAWGGIPCGRTIDVVGPLLHGLSTAADLLPEVDVLQSSQQRRMFAIAYVVLPRKWLQPLGTAPLPTGMVEIPLSSPNCHSRESQTSGTSESGSVCSSNYSKEVNLTANGVCEDISDMPQSPYRLFADPKVVTLSGVRPTTTTSSSSPFSSPITLEGCRNSSSSSAVYFTLGRVLAFPPAHEHLFTPSDAYSLASRTAAYLKPVNSSAAAFYDNAPILRRNHASGPASTNVVRAAKIVGADRPASAAAVRHIAQGWLMGLATQLTPSDEDIGVSSAADAGEFYLAWPTRTAFDSAAASTAFVNEREGSSWRHGGGNPRWESISTHINGVITNEIISPNLDRFKCNAMIYASSGFAATSTVSGEAKDVHDVHNRDGPIPAANLVLKASYHPGWRCAVAPLTYNDNSLVQGSVGAYEDVTVGEVLPGFIFVDLPVGNHSVRCDYQPAPHKGQLLAVSGFILAAFTAALVLPALLSGGL